jgi:acyl dehydratase
VADSHSRDMQAGRRVRARNTDHGCTNPAATLAVGTASVSIERTAPGRPARVPRPPIDRACVGSTLRTTFVYGWPDVVQYALAIGAGSGELDYLYEACGPKVFPTFAVIPSYPVVYELNRRLGGDPLGVVHLGQQIRLYEELPPHGRLSVLGKVAGVYDHGALASSQVTTQTWDDAHRLLCETRWTVGFMRDGNFGGDRPPRRRRARPPARPCDFRSDHVTSPVQAFMYRLTGDHNPLHVDAAIASLSGFSRPILHGLCTYGFVCRAALQWCRDARLSAIQEFGAEFRRPVHPGETLVIEGWRTNTGLVLRVTTEGDGSDVLQNAYIETSAAARGLSATNTNLNEPEMEH